MKTKLGKRNALYPMPTVLVGMLVDGRPNFITVAHVGIMDLTTISISVKREHYSDKGIKKTKEFSINIPSARLVKEVDFCGMFSGERADKSDLFHVFAGKATDAPMIDECPLNMECRVVKTLDYSGHDVFIAEIVETHCDDDVLVDGKVDPGKLDPILFFMEDRGYHSLGGKIAAAWSAGEELLDRNGR
jgi:flavin reductase (DIM6/NTAB) family NADH-FMN oxidoreductase RutF